MFQGTSLLTLDAKGRMTVPARHRETLVQCCALKMTLTRHPDGCLLLYPQPLWEQKKAALVALSYRARVLQRIVLGSAVEVEVDAAGRLQIPSELRVLCHLGKEVALVGLGTHFEVWDTDRLAALEAQSLAAGLTDDAATFAF